LHGSIRPPFAKALTAVGQRAEGFLCVCGQGVGKPVL
jgi:hypothetical protein